MTILIAYASKHGSTQAIAERITEKLRQMGMGMRSQPPINMPFAGPDGWGSTITPARGQELGAQHPR